MTKKIDETPALLRSREHYIDIAKGIGIYFIVLGHSVGNSHFLHPYLYSFHVPLFFILSGMVFRYDKTVPCLEFLKKSNYSTNRILLSRFD